MDPVYIAPIGVLTVLLATARAATQCHIVLAPCGGAACIARRNRLLGAITAVAGVAYGHLVGVDGWMTCAAILNTMSSVVAVMTPTARPTTGDTK